MIIKNKNLSATILEYGATIQKLQFCGVNTVLGYETESEYKQNNDYLGAVIGRCANRIDGGIFKLNGSEYHLTCNEDERGHLHGGFVGLDKKNWKTSELGNNYVIMSTGLSDGEEGYPGNISISIKYAIIDDAFEITYNATSDADTVFNPTNHSYFNPNGKGDILDCVLKISSDYVTPVNEKMIPLGMLMPVKDTPFDFNKPKLIQKDIFQEREQLEICGGYDHNYVLNGTAVLYSQKTGIKITCETTMPGLQLYTGNFLSYKYKKYSGVCLETQFYPNSLNVAEFPQPILRAGEFFTSKTKYAFEKCKSF